MSEFTYEGHRISYDSYGEGERVLVLVHGLLMNRRMFDPLAPFLARQGNRVICVDLLGHGRSGRPEDLRLYSMPLFARQVEALLDHMEQDRAVVGGTSLGANVTLELAVRSPERVRGLFIEMPVLDNALAAVAGAFTPVLLGLRYGRPLFELTSRITSPSPAPTTSSTSASTGSASAPALRAPCSRACCWGRRHRIAKRGAASANPR